MLNISLVSSSSGSLRRLIILFVSLFYTCVYYFIAVSLRDEYDTCRLFLYAARPMN